MADIFKKKSSSDENDKLSNIVLTDVTLVVAILIVCSDNYLNTTQNVILISLSLVFERLSGTSDMYLNLFALVCKIYLN